MSNMTNKRKKKEAPQYIFRGKSGRKTKTLLRNSLEALIMLIIGSNLILFLNKLPNGFNMKISLLEPWTEISQSILQLFGSFAKISGAFIILLLLITSLILIIGGILRLIRVGLAIRSRNKTIKS